MAALLLLLLALPSWAGELSKDEVRWARECMKRIGTNSPRVREGAERALIELGLDVLPLVAEAWSKREGRAERAGFLRVFEGLGTSKVLRALGRMRTEARAREAKRLDALMAALGGGGEGASDGVVRIALTPSIEIDERRVPVGAEHEIEDGLPRALGLGLRRVVRDGAALTVDVDGDGTPEVTVRESESRVLDFATGSRTRPVLVHAKLGVWHAASASLLKGEAGGRRVQLLDGDLDGTFDGANDYIRAEGGAFTRVKAPHLLLWGDGLVRYEVAWQDGAAELRLHALDAPRELGAGQKRGLLALNRFRRDVGLMPLRYDAKRSKGCREHAEYLGLHGSKGGAHRQDRNARGYTPEGAAAAERSNVGPGPLPEVVERIARTMLHRVRWLCAASETVGLGRSTRGDGWSVVWTGPGAADGNRPVLVPAPGAVRVPTTASAENPRPDGRPGFYDRKRGYPISATLGTLALTDVQIRLFEADGATPVTGRLFTPATPVSASLPGNGGSVFLVPDRALRSGRVYWALLTARQGGRALRYAWAFRTQ